MTSGNKCENIPVLSFDIPADEDVLDLCEYLSDLYSHILDLLENPPKSGPHTIICYTEEEVDYWSESAQVREGLARIAIPLIPCNVPFLFDEEVDDD